MDCIRGPVVSSRQASWNRVVVRGLSWATVCGGILLVAGCGAPSGPERIPIMGNVVREGELVDTGTIQFVPSGGGPAAQTAIKDGRYQFTKENGPVEGKQTVNIVQFALRAEAEPGTPKKDAEILPDTRFKKPMPPGGWMTETTVEKDQDLTVAVDFDVDDAVAFTTKKSRGKD